MDKLTPAQIWKQLLQELEQKNLKGYSLWLQGTTPEKLTEDALLLDVPNNITKDTIEERYQSYLEETLASICGHPMKLQYRIVPQKNTEDDLFAPTPLQQQEAAPTTAEKEVKQPFHSNLSPKYKFENFVVGNSNRFAQAAAKAVADNPGKAYNPFFLYSNSGLGKTHLMNAIGNRILENHPEMKVLYFSSETFTNEMIAALGQNKMQPFKDKYRNIDVLIIDDIQFLRGKESIQEEFFHTFNTLYENNKQIIISSDRSPKELDKLDERLITRFSQGLPADIQPPDLETRMAILRNMAVKDNLIFPNDVILMIASSVKKNVRELEGAYTKVKAHAILTGQPITLELVRNSLKELSISDTPNFVTVEAIQQQVAAAYKLKVDELIAKKRTKRVAYPRQIAIYLTRELSGLSLPKIGEYFGGRDHSTVIHAWEKIKKEREQNPDLDKLIADLTAKLKQ